MLDILLTGVLVAGSSAPAAAVAEPSRLRVELPPVSLTVAFAGECAASEATLALARAEAARVWSRAGVQLRWVQVSQVPFAGPATEWVLVRCVDRAAARTPGESANVLPIAVIRFIDGRPTNTIALHVANAETLLRHDAAESRKSWGAFVSLQGIRLGRMLGRAIAHEIGHFLNASGAHTAAGLMRARHTVAALTGASLDPFSVAPVS